jgi:hypothetical protein
MVAGQCGCTLDAKGRELKSKLPVLLAMLNDRAIVLLQQIFLDCYDSFSNFRFAVFLSSRYSALVYKFVMDGRVGGKSKLEHCLDVCIYSRQTGDLVAIGMQNKNQQAADSKALSEFLSAIEDIRGAHPNVQSAYYASSYGYEGDFHQARKNSKRKGKGDSEKMEIKFLEYKDKIYFESKSLSP